MSDTQLAAFFRKKTTSSVCGRFMEDQLNREIEIPKKRIPWVKYFFQLIIPAFLVSAKAKAQGNVIVKRTDTTLTPSSGKPAVAHPAADKGNEERIVRGRVVDANSNPLNGVNILYKCGKAIQAGTISDIDGSFQLQFKKTETKIKLEISYIGFESQQVSICIPDVKELKIDSIILKPEQGWNLDGVVLGGITTFSSTTRKSEKKKKAKPELVLPAITDTASSCFRLFPNPVVAGANLNIGVKEKPEEGYYSVELIDLSGRSVHRQEIWIDKEARLLTLDMPLVQAGSYFVTITGKKTGKRVTEKLVIR